MNNTLTAAARFKIWADATMLATDLYGWDRLGDEHKKAFDYIARRLTALASGTLHTEWHKDSIRLAFGHPWGAGKTLMAKAWMVSVVKNGAPFSVVYSASEINELIRVRADLIALGVPESDIGLWHTYGSAVSVPATPEDELSRKRILLCSHNLIRKRKENVAIYNTFQGGPRSILIHDESLSMSTTRSVVNKEVANGRDTLKNEITYAYGERDNLIPLRDYVADCSRLLDAEQAAQQRGEEPKELPLPDISDYEPGLQPDTAKARLPEKLVPIPGQPTTGIREVRTLLEMTGCLARVISADKKGAAFFTPIISDQLRSVFVMDSSHDLRSLTNDMGIFDNDQDAPKINFDYSDLTIEWFYAPCGYTAIAAELSKKNRKHRKLLSTVSGWLKDNLGTAQGSSEPTKANLWTFKQRRKGDDTGVSEVLRHLKAEGIDTSNITIETHGRGKGTNDMKGATVTVLYGLYSLEKLIVATEMVGQSQDLLVKIDKLNAVYLEEIMHELTQEIARSNIRNIDNGKAGAGRVLLPIFPNAAGIVPLLDQWPAFAGAKVVHRTDLEARWDGGKKAKGVEPKKVQVARLILAYLDSLPSETEAVSFKAVKKSITQQATFKITKDIWQAAIAYVRVFGVVLLRGRGALNLDEIAWKVDGQHFVRLTATDYGLAA